MSHDENPDEHKILINFRIIISDRNLRGIFRETLTKNSNGCMRWSKNIFLFVIHSRRSNQTHFCACYNDQIAIIFETNQNESERYSHSMKETYVSLRRGGTRRLDRRLAAVVSGTMRAIVSSWCPGGYWREKYLLSIQVTLLVPLRDHRLALLHRSRSFLSVFLFNGKDFSVFRAQTRVKVPTSTSLDPRTIIDETLSVGKPIYTHSIYHPREIEIRDNTRERFHKREIKWRIVIYFYPGKIRGRVRIRVKERTRPQLCDKFYGITYNYDVVITTTTTATTTTMRNITPSHGGTLA